MKHAFASTTDLPSSVDALIIGGGFYGVAIAAYLVEKRHMRHILLLEREQKLLQRASYHNQARIHNGYHYPRSFTTAFRSRINFPRFINDWPTAVTRDFTKLYAIARRNSKVTARQFTRFCNDIGAPFKPAAASLQHLFAPQLIEAVFEVEEYAFDADRLKQWAEQTLQHLEIPYALQTEVARIDANRSELQKESEPRLTAHVHVNATQHQEIACRYIFNCTYSRLNQFQGDFTPSRSGLKHEITEMALIHMPPQLRDLGITVMDGPFFSTMPFPARQLHSLSHVRYTPHCSWPDETTIDPDQKRRQYNEPSRIDRMLRDTARYLPAIAHAEVKDRLLEVKTVLRKNEQDDGRPILFEKHNQLPGFYSILGGKIDNIYDILDKLEREPLPL